MDITLQANGIGGRIDVISSKSRLHRLMICAALAKGKTTIRNAIFSKDTQATAGCLDGYVAQIRREGTDLEICPLPEACAGRVLDCGESGSTFRMLLPVAAVLGKGVTFTGSDYLAKRPISPLYEVLCEGGATLSQPGQFPLTCQGRLRPGEYSIAGNVSSQFISGLLFALPMAGGESLLRVTGKVESRPYIDMTLDALWQFGAEIEEVEPNLFRIGSKGLTSPGEIRAEGDWSNGAFWLCAGAVGKGETVLCGNLDPASRQGDRKIVEILRAFGAEIGMDDQGCWVKPSALHGIEIDAADIPDLVPVLAVTAAAATGATRIIHAERLRLKESDRIESTCALINALGGSARPTEDGMIITGGGLQGGRIDSYNDHRIAMSAAVAAVACGKPVTIQNASAADKSYPDFFSIFQSHCV